MKMFVHLFVYKIKMMLNDKTGTFWMIFYPLIMSLFFFVSFGTDGNNAEGYDFKEIPVAISGAAEGENHFMTAAEQSGLFTITVTDYDNAKQLLAEGKIRAILILSEEKISVELAGSGLSESIVRIFADTYSQMNSTVMNVVKINPEILTSGKIEELVSSERSFTADVPLKNTGNLSLYYFSLIGMTAIMCCTLAVSNIDAIQANQCAVAARTAVSPAVKMTIFAAHSLATMIFHYSSLMLSIFFMKYILGVNFGEGTLGYIAIICAAAVFFGVMLGSMVSVIIKKKQTVKTSALIAFSITSSFFAGMMNVNISYEIAKVFPAIKQINPVSLVSDGLYSLYYYESHELLHNNAFLLLAYGAAATVITVIVLRRQKYASI